MAVAVVRDREGWPAGERAAPGAGRGVGRGPADPNAAAVILHVRRVHGRSRAAPGRGYAGARVPSS
jgi:hypothetical protein